MGQVYSVTQVNRYINGLMKEDFLLSHVSIAGEISNLKYHDSGHIYFSLKDEGSVISGIMFSSKRAGLKFRLTDGLKVIVSGRVEVFERDGKFQIYADKIEASGEGDLKKKYEELKAKLAEMGMFDPMYKKPIPKYAQRIGIVTARTGAAVQDIINVASRRNPYAQLILFPAIVQGEECPMSVIAGIKTLEMLGVDIIIVGRGGGSIEDLWGFNDEQLAETVFACSVPIISAVGHETDFTIIDFVADLRAPTPSAASELAVTDIAETLRTLENARIFLNRKMQYHLERAKGKRAEYKASLFRKSPESKLREMKARYEKDSDRLGQGMERKLTQAKHRYALLAEALKGRNPVCKMAGGFAHVERTGGKTVTEVTSVKVGDELRLIMQDGEILSEVKKVTPGGILENKE